MIPYCILVIEDDDDREFMTLLYIRYQRLLYKEIYEILKKTVEHRGHSPGHIGQVDR